MPRKEKILILVSMKTGLLFLLMLCVGQGLMGQRPFPARSENKTSYEFKPDIVLTITMKETD